MDRDREVWDEFGAGDQEEDGYDAGWNGQHFLRQYMRSWQDFRAYVINPASTQHSPNVQPVVTSPLTSLQSKMIAGSGCLPATNVVNTIRTIAAI